LNEELLQYRSVILSVFKFILSKAKEHYDKGEDYTVYFTNIASGITIPPLKLTREVMKYLIESPGVWLGFLYFAWLGNYIPMQGDDNMFDGFFRLDGEEIKKSIIKAWSSKGNV
jgi:hypothetical protein